MESWDPVTFKTLLRTTSQRLGQLQERKDSQSQLARRDIATCLSQGHLALARAKAAMLIQENTMCDLIEELEMQVGVVGRHLGELGSGGAGVALGLWQDVDGAGSDSEARKGQGERGDRMDKSPRLSPVLIEAVASIIHGAPGTECKDLQAVREVLIQRLGPAFVQTASMTRNDYVSSRLKQIMFSPSPTALKMDECLVEIAHTCGIKWVPEPRREDLPNVITEILRVDVCAAPIVDLPRLRELCACGLPDNPPWIRPRIWRLLFGTLPVLKATWAKESQKQRDSYYDLVRRLLAPLASLPSPTDPFSPIDARVARISDSLFRVSPDLFVLLGAEPKNIRSGKCPLDPTAPDTIHIACASDLDKRLALLKGDGDTCETPEIRLESDLNGSDPTPSPSATALASRHPTTLHPSKAYNAPPAHRAHLSALFRLLYIHSSLNPAVQSPHVPWLLVPLYSALAGENNEDDAAHVEADTFWVFEALIGEIAEMEEEDGGKIWTQKLNERIKWADGELAASLHATGLDPNLPHYSYRWLAPLLAQTLPLSSVLPVWDVLFARPMRTRDVNPKLEHLVDVCTALLIRARTPLFRLGRPGRNYDTPGLWTQEHTSLPPPPPLRPWELSDAFKEGTALLTSYPIDAAGGIDRILQTASDLSQKRIELGERGRERENVGFGARIKQRMWKGFTNQVADPSPEEDEEEEDQDGDGDGDGEDDNDEAGEHDDGNETETPAAPTLTSRLANTVWRGITNQSSMDDEVPSPPSPSSSRHSPTPAEEKEIERSPLDPVQSPQVSLWDYAEKLKDSDTVAAFSKVSTNWRAKALDAWRVRKGSNASASSIPTSAPPNLTSEVASRQSGWPNRRRASSPGIHSEGDVTVSDPPRPTFFRSPRESFLPQPRRYHATAPSSPNVGPLLLPPRDSVTESSAAFFHRAGASLTSLASLPSSRSPPKSVPRPLMLTSHNLITTKSQSQSHSEGGTPEYRGGASQWGEVLFAAKYRHPLRQTSVSSMSSLSPSEAMNKSPYPLSGTYARSVGTGPRSDYESDGSAAGRRVALNRKSVSPMALASRSPHLPWNASSPGGRRSPGHPLSNGSLTAEDIETTSECGSKHFGPPIRSTVSTTTTGFDSPTTMGSPSIPPTPLMSAVPGPGAVRIVNGGHVGTSSISTLSEVSEASGAPPLEPPTHSRHVARKKTPPLPVVPATSPPDDGVVTSTLGSESEASELSLVRTPCGKTPVRLRTKRYVQRPGNLRLRPTEQPRTSRTPSPRQPSLTPEWVGECDPATTPKIGCYSGRIIGGEEGKREWEEENPGVVSSRPIVRKLSKEVRLKEARRGRDSSAEEGDDEGYGDLLSAYESEEGSRE